jgi:FlaA1/EpsC-like NDP-sugar epimerase
MRGLRPDIDIDIVYTGVRPGEKLHEELVLAGDESFETEHPMIRRIQTWHLLHGEFELAELYELAEENRTSALVARLTALCEDAERPHPLTLRDTTASQQQESEVN